MSDDYPKFGKIPRLNRDVMITEKIDGTNGLVSVQPAAPGGGHSAEGTFVQVGNDTYLVRAGSRNRWLTREADNFGFAAWVSDNARELAVRLGIGLHYGEWWGSGIQRGYGLTNGERRFSLFNTDRWNVFGPEVPGLGVVPVLERTTGRFLNDVVADELAWLGVSGSVAAPGFMHPEGVVVWHSAARQLFKVTLEGDESPKGE